MQYIKTVLKRTGSDLTLDFPVSTDEQLNGLQQPVDEFVSSETGLSINPVDSKDTFRYSPIVDIDLEAWFFSGVTYDTTYEAAGFDTDDIVFSDEVILRSFYLLQVFDTTKTSNQTLLHSGYFTGYNFLPISGSGSTIYQYGNATEFSDLYIPNWYVDTLTGATTLYGKLSFYNSKTGELQLFSQTSGSYVIPTGDTDMYFEISLSGDSFAYELPNGVIYSYELQNADYTEKINNTLDSFDNQKPTYPTGDTFINTGKYE